jgi:hypothetical protein
MLSESRLFGQILRQHMEVGIVERKRLSVDGSFVETNAASQSRIPHLDAAGSITPCGSI